jgi:hypothetical protein
MAEQRLKCKDTECYSSMPIAVQACLRIRRLALHFCIGSTYAAKHKDVPFMEQRT